MVSFLLHKSHAWKPLWFFWYLLLSIVKSFTQLSRKVYKTIWSFWIQIKFVWGYSNFGSWSNKGIDKENWRILNYHFGSSESLHFCIQNLIIFYLKQTHKMPVSFSFAEPLIIKGFCFSTIKLFLSRWRCHWTPE